MKYLKQFLLVLCLGYAFFPISGAAQNARPDFNRKQTFDVQHYLIRTSFDQKKREVYGDTTITLKPLAADLKSIELDAVSLSFKKVVLEPSNTELKFRTLSDKIVVELDRSYGPTDTISVRLNYAAVKPRKGVYFNEPLMEDGKEVRSAQIYTQGEPDEHRHWFPSFDFPSDKATSEQMITVPKDLTVIANGELLSKAESGDGTVMWHYKMPIQHSTYLISFVIGKYVKVEDKYKQVPLGFFVYPGREEIVPKAYGNTKEMMRIFEELTGVEFPYNKYDQTIVAAFNFGGMENITATTMADSEIFYAAIPFLQGNVEDLVSHELAHSWFGNLVTCKNWAELWLNEGFATFMEAAYREKMYGRKDYIRKINGNAESFMVEDALPLKKHGLFNQDADNVAALFDHSGVTYSKGGAVLHMLREQVGENAFWKAVNVYLERHQFGNVESTDLRKVMEETSGQDLGWFFDQWVYGTGYPKLSVTQSWNPVKKTITLTVNQIQRTGGLNIAVFRLPMDVEFLSGNTVIEKQKIEIRKRTETFSFKLNKKPASLVFDKESRIPIKSIKLLPLR